MITSAGSDRSLYVAKIISEYFPPNKDFSDFKVLDLAAGTGVLGPHLKKMGIQHLTAVGKVIKLIYLASGMMHVKQSIDILCKEALSL